MKRTLKGLVGSLVFGTGLHRPLGSGRALVLAFHRIDADLASRGDPLSCSAERFRRFCAFLARHFQVVRLEALVQRLAGGEDLSGLAAVTFDDGYAQAFEQGAPVLRELGLPGCFFVVTDFLGTSRQALWDRERGISSRWMDWSQVRALAAQGFEIGAHTRSHLDLARLSPELAREEIRGSKLRLERELAAPVRLFSFPFGGHEHTSAGVRALVREAGFSCCIAAHGGVVSARSDPYDLPRVQVSPWFASPQQLGLECLLPSRRAAGAGPALER